MPKFNIGDEVVIINDDNYGITTIGSIGIVITLTQSNKVEVQFKTFGKEKQKAGTPDNFWINTIDLAHLVHLSPQELVLKKIKEMEERRKPRLAPQPVEYSKEYDNHAVSW